MNTWFEVGVKYSKMGEDGREKRITEVYLLDAITFGEAEVRIYKELEKMISGEFTVTKIARTNLSEIIPDTHGDRWYKGKVTFITFDETSGKEKRISQFVLCYADSVDSSDKKIIDAMKGMMADFEITAIAESPIVDVFPYVKED